MTQNTLMHIEAVSKRFGSVLAVDEVTLDIHSGEIFALLGPSGCGKSTLLRMIAGLESPSAGDIRLDGTSIVKTPANKRPINMVFQSYAVFPHMTVADNVAYGLRAEGVGAAEIEKRVSQSLEQVHLLEQRDRKPHQLSGGQRQRVALARALIKRPRVLLLDEPLSALDAKLRDQMRLELVKLQESVGVTFIIVTHDQSEAMAMADRIAVLKDGRLRQIASPKALYQHPTDTFVADFIGKINLFSVQTLSRSGNRILVSSQQLGDIEFDADELTEEQRLRIDGIQSDDASPLGWQLGLRPEKLRILQAKESDDVIVLNGRIGDIAFQGVNSEIEILIDNPHSGSQSLHVVASADDMIALQGVESGQMVSCGFNAFDLLLLPDNG